MPRDIDWSNSVLRVIASYPEGTCFTADRIRIDTARKKVPQPARSGMWGRVVQQASRDGLIKKTGRYAPSTIKFMHGRIQAEWVRI